MNQKEHLVPCVLLFNPNPTKHIMAIHADYKWPHLSHNPKSFRSFKSIKPTEKERNCRSGGWSVTPKPPNTSLFNDFVLVVYYIKTFYVGYDPTKPRQINEEQCIHHYNP